MRTNTLLLAFGLVLAAGAAQARLLDPAAVKSFCKQNNGTYWPQGGTSHTYGCLSDALLIVCGGVTPAQRNSCYTGRQAPHFRLPRSPASGGVRH
ncbi:MAG TPA: hypothetical protein VGI30_10205 [Caulobacteraceae bacterium]|jgi:hypothetical protein